MDHSDHCGGVQARNHSMIKVGQAKSFSTLNHTQWSCFHELLRSDLPHTFIHIDSALKEVFFANHSSFHSQEIHSSVYDPSTFQKWY
jgi:hypothetical protein